MGSKDDSGFNSDHKYVVLKETLPYESQKVESRNMKSFGQASDLQKKIEKQRERNKQIQIIDEQPKRALLLPRSRLNIPMKTSAKSAELQDHHNHQPLVAIVSDDSEEDEFDVPRLSKEAHREITEQLIKDGYNLDLDPDDEDLDLIPPRPLHERCGCCPSITWIPQKCAIQ